MNHPNLGACIGQRPKTRGSMGRHLLPEDRYLHAAVLGLSGPTGARFVEVILRVASARLGIMGAKRDRICESSSPAQGNHLPSTWRHPTSPVACDVPTAPTELPALIRDAPPRSQFGAVRARCWPCPRTTTPAVTVERATTFEVSPLRSWSASVAGASAGTPSWRRERRVEAECSCSSCAQRRPRTHRPRSPRS